MVRTARWWSQGRDEMYLPMLLKLHARKYTWHVVRRLAAGWRADQDVA